MSARQNILARNLMTRALGGYAPLTAPEIHDGPCTAAEASDILFGVAYKQAGMATLKDCEAIYHLLVVRRGEKEAKAVLQRFGVRYLSDLFAGLHNDFFAYCHAVLTYGASPLLGWNLDSIPHRIRDRWLFWCPKDDVLFEVEGKLKDGVPAEYKDVTGDPGFEMRLKRTGSAPLNPPKPKEEEL